MANPCPCEVIVNESLSNDPPNTMTDSTASQLNEDETLEGYLDQLLAVSQADPSADLLALYKSLQQSKNIDTNEKRLKRPSWAAVGKRANALDNNNKRPSWAQAG